MGRWLETYQTPEEILMGRIKTISLGVIARFKSENPDFDIDFETFVKELTTDETQLTRLFEILIKDSYKRTKRLSRSSSQAPPPSGSPGNGEARFARLIQQHQQQRLLAARSQIENEQHAGREVTADGTVLRISRSRSPMDVDGVHDPPSTFNRDESLFSLRVGSVSRGREHITSEEDKEEDGVVETGETGSGNVVIA